MNTTRISLLALGLLAPTLPALAQPHHAGMHDMAAMDSAASEPASTRELKAANARMHLGMSIPYSGDADIDFLRGMIAHHQGAVEMAQVQLKYGKDAQVRRMSQEIIRAQNLEIRWMKTWLKQLEDKQKGFSDSNWTGKSWMGER